MSEFQPDADLPPEFPPESGGHAASGHEPPEVTNPFQPPFATPLPSAVDGEFVPATLVEPRRVIWPVFLVVIASIVTGIVVSGITLAAAAAASGNLQSLVRDVLGDFGPEAASTGVEFREEIPEDVVVWCDRRGLYRILSNLVDNAVKYNRRGGWVEAWARTENDEVTIRISDGGEGIPASELRAVSQRFYRVDRARTPGQGGLGLGLAIVKHMVQYMGGRLDLRSREGVGTTVTINLPLAPSSDAF